MLHKKNTFLYLRQPFVYHDEAFYSQYYNGASAVNFSKNPYTSIYGKNDYCKVTNGASSADSSNYKININATVGQTTQKFINCVGGIYTGGVGINDLHIGRVFNRSLPPSETDCFFSSGNMGSSNGSVTPDLPSGWSKKDKDVFASADVYVLNILNTGVTGVSKFRYATYPYNAFNGKIEFRTDSIPLFTEFGALYFEDSSNMSEIKVGVSNKYKISQSGSYAESRNHGEDGFNFILSHSKDKIKIYTDPSFTKLDHEISLYESGSPINIEYATFADGNLYGIDSTGNVYSVDVSTGLCTEISAASQTGSQVAIASNIRQNRVYCIVDGNVKIIDPTDNSVSTATYSLPTTPNLHTDWFFKFGFDYEDGIWLYYNGYAKKYNPDSLEENIIITAESSPGSWKTMFILANFVGVLVDTGDYEYDFYDLDGNKIQTLYGLATTSSYAGIFDINPYIFTLDDPVYIGYLSLLMTPDDVKKIGYRGSQKDWRIHDGFSWVKGWYKDETPSGNVDSSNQTFTCLNVPTAILAGTLNITVDGGTPITDNGDGSLSDGGSVTYSTGAFTLATAPTTSITVDYELTSEAVTGTGIDLQDGVVVDFADGVEAPHFVEGEYFSFTVAEGHIVDNLEAYSASVDLYVVPYHDVSDETFTINATSMDVAATVNTGFIKVESDIGLTGTIAGSEATIITSGDPAAGEILVDYNSGALTFHVDDVGSTAVISYRWLERPNS